MLAAGTVLVQLVGSALVVSGWLRWLGALGLAAFTVAATVLAHAFWSLEPGRERMREAIVFGEHLGLTGTFLFVAWWDLARDRGEAR
jgi:uncharacterized membrane protein YphA (DoxX/SURF4 family)